MKWYLPFSVQIKIPKMFGEGCDVGGEEKKKNVKDNLLDSDVRE